MQNNPLLELLKCSKEIIEKSDLISKYKNLAELLSKSNTKSNGESFKRSLSENIARIIEIQQELEPLLWYAPMKDFFIKSNEESTFGAKAIQHLSPMLNYSAEKNKVFLKEINEKTNSIISSLESITHFIKEFESVYCTEEIENNTYTGKKVFRIYFTNNVSITTLEELEKYSRIWNGILSVFTNLAREEDKTINIIFVDKGYLKIFLGSNTAKAVLKAIFDILTTRRRLLEIKKLKQEIKYVKLSNESEFDKLLEEESANIIEEHSTTLSKDLMSMFDWDEDRNQTVFDKLKISTQQLLTFIEKGGKINAIQSDKTDELNIISKNIVTEFQRIIEN